MSLFGLEPSYPLPEKFTPLEVVAVVKCLDDDGDLTLVVASTPDLTGWERLGMLQAALDTARENVQQGFIPDGDDEDDDS